MRFVLAAVLVSLSSPAFTAPIVFADRVTFNIATTDRTITDFESLTPGAQCLPVVPGTDPCALTLNGVTFTARLGIPPGPFAARPELQSVSGGLRINATPMDDDDFTADFTGKGVALELYAGPPNPLIRLVLTEVGGGTTTYDTFAGMNGGFFGATSTLGFTHLAMFSSPLDCCNPFRIDNFTTASGLAELIAPPVALPEPTSLVLLGSGLIALARRRRRAASGAA